MIAAYRLSQPKSVDLVWGSRMALFYIHQVNQVNYWNDLCHYDSTINIVRVIIYYYYYCYFYICCYTGLWPSFLKSGSDSSHRHVLDANLVDHFVSAQHDGSMITWAHAANSRERLKQALMSRFSMFIVQSMYPVLSKVDDFVTL